jgi:hypothetical protein
MSFIAIPDSRYLDTLRILEISESDIPAGDTGFSGLRLSNDWNIIFAHRDNGTFSEEEILRSLSEQCEVLEALFIDSTMFSYAISWKNGEVNWAVVHDPSVSRNSLQVEGTPPPQFEDIRRRLIEEQSKEDEITNTCDYIYSIPIELVFAITGYNHEANNPEGDWVEYAQSISPKK